MNLKVPTTKEYKVQSFIYQIIMALRFQKERPRETRPIKKEDEVKF